MEDYCSLKEEHLNETVFTLRQELLNSLNDSKIILLSFGVHG